MMDIDGLSDQIAGQLTEILFYLETCEEQSRELLKVANCIFDHDDYFEFLDTFQSFLERREMLENLLTQIETPPPVLQVMTLQSMVWALKQTFDHLTQFIDDANTLIDRDEIDLRRAAVIGQLDAYFKFDVLDFESFEAAIEFKFLVMGRPFEVPKASADSPYKNLNVLKIYGFPDRISAYKKALALGVGRDGILEII